MHDAEIVRLNSEDPEEVNIVEPRHLATVTGRRFAYKYDSAGGLDVHLDTGSRIPIARDVIEEVRRIIRTRRDVVMGACRDKPTPGSLGQALLDGHLASPQVLSYLIPILNNEGLCSVYKEGRGFKV